MSPLDLIDRVTEAMDHRRENAIPTRFEKMDGTTQRTEIIYYCLDEQGRFIPAKADELRAALNDHLNPQEVLRAWRAADGTKLLQLIDQAYARGLASAINENNARMENAA